MPITIENRASRSAKELVAYFVEAERADGDCAHTARDQHDAGGPLLHRRTAHSSPASQK